MTEQQILDLSYLKSFIDTKDEMRETADMFERSADKALDQAQNAANDDDHTRWVEATHQMKGAASMIGALALSSVCDEAQNLTLEQKTQYAQLIQKIQKEYDSVKLVLNKEIVNFSE